MLITLAYGCEGKSSYKVLSFFFDGVPLPGETNKAGAKKEDPTAAANKKEIYREHGPYAAKQCEGCHVRGSNKLLFPIEELCLRCHAMNISKQYIHGPLASGGCKICHEPHGSRYPFLLVAEANVFCLYCHNKNDILKREVHKGMEEQCTVCHDAHSSDKQYLLK
jgi:predicted CXXCH cytochrome family protein